MKATIVNLGENKAFSEEWYVFELEPYYKDVKYISIHIMNVSGIAWLYKENCQDVSHNRANSNLILQSNILDDSFKTIDFVMNKIGYSISKEKYEHNTYYHSYKLL